MTRPASPPGGVRPGTPNPPNAPDLSQPTAAEATQSAAEREALEREIRANLQRDRDRIDPDRRAVTAREEDDRYVDHDGDIGAARGGRERGINDDWSRAPSGTDPVRRARVRLLFDDALLPNLPHRPGWHRCWVNTLHQTDTPQRRLRLGYNFVKYEDIAKDGWASDELRVKDASSVYTGCVMWREMVAMETDEANFIDIMRELHHDAPMDQARGIYEQLEAASEQITDRGGRVMMAPGMATLRQFTRPPKQFET